MGMITGVYGVVSTPLSLTPGGAMVMGPPGVALGVVKVSIDAAYTNSFSPGDVLSIAGAGIGSFAGMALVAGASLSILPALLVTAAALTIAGGILNLSGYRVPIFSTAENLLSSMEMEGWGGGYAGEIDAGVQTHFRASQLSGSPLILDLDGDGIEITQHTGAITFDHDANGIETGTAWAGADDGLLVLDRDGNGDIDSGRELFGNNTLLANGQKAADGYAALRELDANADGVLDASDAAFANLRVWRDLDQDGNSDAGELFSLAELGVSQIGLSKTPFSQTLADGTRLDGTGSFVIDGQARSYTDAWFAENPFYREFATRSNRWRRQLLDAAATREIPCSEDVHHEPVLKIFGRIDSWRELRAIV
jgi:hypothetical protein